MQYILECGPRAAYVYSACAALGPEKLPLPGFYLTIIKIIQYNRKIKQIASQISTFVLLHLNVTNYDSLEKAKT